MELNWISVDLKIPQDGEPVLVYGECCEVCSHIKIAEIENGSWWETSTGDDLILKPSHWMPLPITPIKTIVKI